MNLAAQQRKLLGLVKGAYQPSCSDNSYIRAVAVPPHLKLVQQIGFLWQIYMLERSCPLTVAALKKRGLYLETGRDFTRRDDTSAYRETQTSDFLTRMSRHDDGLIREVAQFERALTGAKQGQMAEQVILWQHSPYMTLHALLSDLPLPEETSTGYEVVVSAALPGFFRVNDLDGI